MLRDSLINPSERRPRLLSVSVTTGADATGRVAASVLRAAAQAGMETLMAFGRGEAARDFPSIKVSDTPGILLHALATRLADRHGLGSRAATRRLIEVIDNFAPDIIHLNNIHGYYINYPILFRHLAAKGIPTVWTLHDCWPLTGHCAYFHSCDSWQSGCRGVCPQRRAYPASMGISAAARNFDLKKEMFNLPGLKLHLVGVSEWTTRVIKESLLANYPVSTILNGVDTAVFHPVPGQEKYSHPVLLGVARSWESRKGLSDFASLASAMPPHWRLRLIGVPPSLAAKLPDRIETVPYIDSRPRLAAEYAAATVFANLTYADTCAMTQLEALACGTPVVTYASGGAPEAVDHSTGSIVAPGDIKALIDAIERAAALNRDDCRARATSLYSEQTMTSRYLALIKAKST